MSELLRFISLVRSKSLIEDRFMRRYAQWTRSPLSATGAFLGLREFSPILYGDALGVLTDFGVIDQNVRLPPDEPPIVSYTVHNLARATLRSLFADASDEWAWVSANIISVIISLGGHERVRWRERACLGSPSPAGWMLKRAATSISRS